ncbi:MAG: DNA recombination protein RmuC [Chlorobi bacterium]|nr:DNA recombination protein RmuC [Chlorobiota bacterium]
MTETLLIVTVALLLINIILTIVKSKNKGDNDLKDIQSVLTDLKTSADGSDSMVRSEFKANREEFAASAQAGREESNKSVKNLSDTISNNMRNMADIQKSQLDGFSDSLAKLTESNESKLDKTTSVLEENLKSFRGRMDENAATDRNELKDSLKAFGSDFKTGINEFNELQQQEFRNLTARQEEMGKASVESYEKTRAAVEDKLTAIQKDNNKQLEEMRMTVDEKLHKTLETRLGQAFEQVTEKLGQVQKGLGEMQSLAVGVGDLKKVLSNVKTRGMIGEYQLANILEEILTPTQYDKNVKTNPDGSGFVEFAVKLPGPDKGKALWLPIDSKFPIEDYQALSDAYDLGDPAAVEQARKTLAGKIKTFAKDIRDKYIAPPHTTDFAIMFLPIEGLYAEVLRDTSLFETLQRDFKITVTGPTTLAALLNSLQMGFRTLAIQKRSSEVWELLGTVKKDFGTFGDLLEKTEKKLAETGNVIKKASVRSRAIERQLRNVEELPANETANLIELNDEE